MSYVEFAINTYDGQKKKVNQRSNGEVGEDSVDTNEGTERLIGRPSNQRVNYKRRSK